MSPRWGVLVGVITLLLESSGLAAPVALGPGDRASVATAMMALSADPFAEMPFNELVRIYQRGPGLEALVADIRNQAEGRGITSSLSVLLGRAELRRGRRDDGIKALRRALELHPSAGLARQLATTLDDNGDRETAIHAFILGLDGASPTEQKEIHLRLGTLYLAGRKTKEAQASWDRAKQLAPADQALRRRIAEAWASRGAYREAIAELKQIESTLKQDSVPRIDLLRREADYARRANDGPTSLSLLLEAYTISLEVANPRLEEELSRALRLEYRRQSRQDELLKITLARSQENPKLNALLGDLYSERKQQDRALDFYRRALEASPLDRYVLRRLCEFEQGEGRLRALRALARLDPNDVKLSTDVMEALFDAKLEQDALAEAKSIRDRFANNAAVLFSLGEILSARRQPKEALDLYDRVIKLEGARAEYLIARGDCLRALGRKDEAIRSYWQLLGNNSPQTAVYQRLIKLLQDRNESAEVTKAYRAALEKAPKDYLLRRNFALWLSQQGLNAEAKVEWSRLKEEASDAFLKKQASHAIDQIERKLLLHQ